jgi:hypothetical protein
MKYRLVAAAPVRAALILPVSFALLLVGSANAQTLDRTLLPVPEPAPPVITTLDARDAKPPPRFAMKAPKGAPNVVAVLLDDIGFGQSSAFGGPVKMATLDTLAAEGLRYNNFHTTALVRQWELGSTGPSGVSGMPKLASEGEQKRERTAETSGGAG